MAVMPKETLDRDYGRLTRFLRGISLRFQLRSALEFLLLLASGFMVVLLGSLFAQELRGLFPYLPFVYCLGAILFLFALVCFGLWRIFSRPPMERVAKGLEERFPHLRDDVTNSLLLFDQVKRGTGVGQVSPGLISAQLKKTAGEVCALRPQQVVTLKTALRHLKLLVPLGVALFAVLAFDPHFVNRSLALIMNPLSALPVKEIHITVEPEGATVLRSTPVVIHARISGSKPESLTLAVWPDDREEMRLQMKPKSDGTFTYEMASAQFSFRYQAQYGPGVSGVYTLRVVDPPDIGKVRLTLIPPDYSGLPKEVKEEGHIEALKGTVVNLEARTTRVVQEARIILNEGNQLPLEIKAERLTGSLLVFNPGAYSIKVKDLLGFENPNPVQYPIRLIPDKFPEGEIISPAEDLEVSGSEVIPIVYTAGDDFGVTAVRLTHQVGGRERLINLKTAVNSRFIGPETFRWDLSSLALTPGERVVYRVEIWDNDSVSGPKVGYSKSFTFSVRDDRARAAKEGEEAQQIADALLDLLADQLEDTRDKTALAQGMDEILKRVDKNLERMGERVERLDYDALKRNLSSLKERMTEAPKETVTQEMERLSLLAEDIAKRARMSEVEALAREIRNRERRLIDTLSEFKGPLSKEALDAVMKELKSLEDLIRTVMEAMSKLATRLPEEFINSQDVSGMDFQDLFQDLNEIQKKLMAGDIAGALEAAQRLLQALTEMMASLGRAGSQAGMSPFGRVQEEMNRQAGELDKILSEQKDILGQTEGIDKAVRRLVEEETGKRLRESMPEMKETLEALDRSLLPEQQEVIEELGTLLKEGKLERFSEVMRGLDNEVTDRPEAQKSLRRLKEITEGLVSDPKEVLAPRVKERFPGLSSRQETLKERTAGLAEKLEMLAQLFPGMDTEILNDIKAAAGSMGEATAKLKSEDAPGAIPPEQDVIRRLSQSQQGMQQMAQQMAMRMQAARWGYQLVYDPRPGWYYGPWVPMPTLPQPELNRPRERGYTGIDKEEFEPPSKDAYKVPKVFREKIMESLKEGIPSQYRREVEDYFRGLSE
jgi:hypothetical protein